MSPFSIAIIIGIVLMGIAIAIGGGGFAILSPLFFIGALVFLAGIAAKIRKWWAKGYN